MRRIPATVLALALTLNAALASAEPRPAGLRPAADTDEGGLWDVSGRAEQGAKTSSERESDPELNAWIKGLACKLAPEYCPELRVYVMNRPFFNAQMAPNGYMEVWSGLLLRAETEDQLAFVLGHEISHFAENHSIEAWRAAKARSNAAMAASILIAVAGAAAAAGAGSVNAANNAINTASTVSNIVYLGAVASLFGFSRENEVEADGLGFKRASAAGYDPAAPAALWRALTAETDASDFEKVRREQARASLFNTHPITAERIKALDAMAAAAPKGTAGDRKAYRARIRPHLSAWLKDDLRRRDYGQSLALIERLSTQGEDLGVLGFYRGEAYRQRRGEGDLVKAREAYAKATEQADAPPAAWRALGDLALAAGDKSAAKAAYETYIAKAPTAQDRWLVDGALKTLGEGKAT